jgi:hypothetical protein
MKLAQLSDADRLEIAGPALTGHAMLLADAQRWWNNLPPPSSIFCSTNESLVTSSFHHCSMHCKDSVLYVPLPYKIHHDVEHRNSRVRRLHSGEYYPLLWLAILITKIGSDANVPHCLI